MLYIPRGTTSSSSPLLAQWGGSVHQYQRVVLLFVFFRAGAVVYSSEDSPTQGGRPSPKMDWVSTHSRPLISPFVSLQKNHTRGG